MKSARNIALTILTLLDVVLSTAPASPALVERPFWEQADEIVRRIVVPKFPDRDFIITDFGAAPGGQILCTEAVHKAIDACHKAGGGRVVVPRGRFLVGAIHLRSNVNLHVARGAVLLFSREPRDYLPVVFTRWEGVECMNYSAFIYAFEQENIAITGKGTLDGQADNMHWWPWKGKSEYGYKQGQPEQSSARKKMFDMGQRGVAVSERIFGEAGYMRPNFIQTYRCKNVLIEGITILRSPMWEIHPVLCDSVTVRQVTVDSHGPNNDGCNPESCNGVLIEDCYFDTGDDCIALKSGRNNDGRRVNRPVENVVVKNCRMKDGHGGIVIGSEISGGARNIFAENCLMDSPNLDRMLRIKTNSVRGGTIESIFLRNIRVGQVGDAIFRVNFLYEEGDAGRFTPVVQDVHMSNITAEKSKYGLYLRGYERSPVRDIYLENCDFRNLEKGNLLENIENVSFDDVTMNGRPVNTVEEANRLLSIEKTEADNPTGVDTKAGILEKASIPAFPGAEGAGAFTRGGRGGKVFEVTNLADSGPGSLREAVEADGPRIVVFRVSGIITLDSRLTISNPFITIAGQTAPGDGICIRGQTTEINSHDVVLRYLRFRRGNIKDRNDALGGYPVGNIIVDHCSASWGLDENLSLYRYMKKMPDGSEKKMPAENVTIQWCISSEALDLNNHAFGATWGGRNCSFHHNLFACNTGRNPSIGWGDRFDFRNNVLFNWRHRTVDGGDASSMVNIIANYYKPGPAVNEGASRYRICRPQHLDMHSEAQRDGKWYVADNFVVGNPQVTADNWSGGVQFDDVETEAEIHALIRKVRATKPAPAPAVSQQNAKQAYELVLAQSGATLPRRDSVDRRIVKIVRTGKPTYKNGIIDIPGDVGGWPQYNSAPAPVDSDHDGMPDAWEKRFGLNWNDPSDGGRDTDRDGYTNVEEWLNGTDPTKFVDYNKPGNNMNKLH